MLEKVCANIHNYFISAVYPARYSIMDGMISPAPPLKEGQRFWIVGSDLNDGVYTYREAALMNDDDDMQAELMDEDFSGSICAMSVPKQFVDAVMEGKTWQTDHADALSGPYTSENVSGVYSYTISQEITEAQGNPLGLPARLASSFDRWRKTCL